MKKKVKGCTESLADNGLYCDDIDLNKVDEKFRDWILEIDLQLKDYIEQLNHQWEWEYADTDQIEEYSDALIGDLKKFGCPIKDKYILNCVNIFNAKLRENKARLLFGDIIDFFSNKPDVV
ncbi:MAG: hypothetical protein Hyperionvirus4_52 [Hyperionvirus sp.]|uniref:Uncharacterized protein n=1 Tax=Hyperionvirus sp. TaxID=2487770 RepID=A0A3G5A776_9VIRU|nr:MAG: hypothetical protein Hyperionvirus4_52 [Hyperionvirus sp.]